MRNEYLVGFGWRPSVFGCVFGLGALGLACEALASQEAAPVRVEQPQCASDGRPPELIVRLDRADIASVDVAAEVLDNDGVPIPGTGRSAGKTLRLGDGARKGDAVTLDAPLASPLPNGLYAERIDIITHLADGTLTVPEVAYRYFEVRDRAVTPITSTEYSNRVAVFSLSGEVQAGGGPEILRREPKSVEFSEIVRSGDPVIQRSLEGGPK